MIIASPISLILMMHCSILEKQELYNGIDARCYYFFLTL